MIFSEGSRLLIPLGLHLEVIRKMASRDNMLDYLRNRLDPSARLFLGPTSLLPSQWHDYLNDDPSVRRFALRKELGAFEPYLPSTMRGLELVFIDAMMVETESFGPLRIISRQIGENIYGTYSALPGNSFRNSALSRLFHSHGPQVLTWAYQERMNGLTDTFGFAGFKTTQSLTTMADEIDTYAEADWYEDFSEKYDVSSIIEILATGGGAYLLIDLSLNQSNAEDPEGLVVYMNEGTPPEKVSFFQYLDMFMEIGLTGA